VAQLSERISAAEECWVRVHTGQPPTREWVGATAGSHPTLDGCPCSDDPCRHVRTIRHARSAKPWQDDYLFATGALAERLRDCQPVSEARAWELSDHCPLLAEFQ
jgi:hypothetical protein